MLSFWVVSDAGDHGSILAGTEQDAEKVLFEGILKSEYPVDAMLIEQLLDDWQVEIYEPVADEDIISIE